MSVRVGACSTTQQVPRPEFARQNQPVTSGTVSKPVLGTPAVVPIERPMPVTPAPYPDALTGRALIFKHLPPHIVDSEGWAIDMFAAFAAMDIPVTTGNVCGVIAVIEQESGFSSNPKVPGLSKIALAEVERRRAAAGIPKWSMNLLLDLKSPDGKTYRNRLNAVRTERDLSGIYEDLMYARPFGATLFSYHNPIQTAGSMQVSVTFAEAHIKNRRYPYPIQKDVRNELFSRRGGVYFGVAHLFDYQTSYKKPIYRFADHNAGQYSSRNAAFQAAVSAFTGISIATDGDLLRYKDSTPITTEGVTLSALLANGGRLKLSADQIKQDLLLEKSMASNNSKLTKPFTHLSTSPIRRLCLENLSQIFTYIVPKSSVTEQQRGLLNKLIADSTYVYSVNHTHILFKNMRITQQKNSRVISHEQ
jgi:hypothetical protein